MGFLASSVSFTRFRVIDPVPDELWAEIPQLLRKGAIPDIDETTDSQADGWVSFDDYLDTTWQAGPPQKGAYMAFSLRVDIRRIPAGVVRKRLDLALKREKAANKKKGKKFISRERRKELKEQVQLSLRRRFLPVPGEFNVIWNTANNEIWFASTQTKMLELFVQRFLATFKLHIEQLTPPDLALSILGKDAEEAVHDADSVDYTMDGILGQDFLTWLWFRSDVAFTTFRTGDAQPFQVSMEKRVTVTGFVGVDRETASVTASDTDSPLSEARLGLHRGKKVASALIHLTKDDFVCDVTVKAADFSLNSLKTARLGKSDRDDDPDALFLEKVFLIETAVTLLDSLYRQFLGLRLDRDKWDKTTDEMMQWAKEAF
nr:MAG TPA: recombination-associated protein [Caudoviricetes sp.]